MAFAQSPLDRGPEVAELIVQTPRPDSLLAPTQAQLGLFRELDVVLAVASADLGSVAMLIQPLGGVFADRREHVQARTSTRRLAAHREVLRDQCRERAHVGVRDGL